VPNSSIFNLGVTTESSALGYTSSPHRKHGKGAVQFFPAGFSLHDSVLSFYFQGRLVRVFATTALALFLLLVTACGGGNSPNSTTNGVIGPLNGNWQLNLLQQYPVPVITLSASGFLIQSKNSLTGSIQVPPIGLNSATNCAGVGQLNGTISGQSIAFSINPGGTTYNFTGTISSDFTSMSGDYQALGGACYTEPTTGTWNALLIPPLNGNFTGEINSGYMGSLTGSAGLVPVKVSGTLSQTPNTGGNNASLSGTIIAQGYPCFATASLTGTVSGNTVILSIFGYNGDLIGSIGNANISPAVVTASSTGINISTLDNSGYALGNSSSGPCPSIDPISSLQPSPTSDEGGISLTFE
jgi:hypothetical protein